MLNELGAPIGGWTLRVACVYGDFSVRLADLIAPGGSLDVVDVLPIQLQNLRRKLTTSTPVTLHHRDSTALGFSDASYDQAVIFDLLQTPLERRTFRVGATVGSALPRGRWSGMPPGCAHSGHGHEPAPGAGSLLPQPT